MISCFAFLKPFEFNLESIEKYSFTNGIEKNNIILNRNDFAYANRLILDNKSYFEIYPYFFHPFALEYDVDLYSRSVSRIIPNLTYAYFCDIRGLIVVIESTKNKDFDLEKGIKGTFVPFNSQLLSDVQKIDELKGKQIFSYVFYEKSNFYFEKIPLLTFIIVLIYVDIILVRKLLIQYSNHKERPIYNCLGIYQLDEAEIDKIFENPKKHKNIYYTDDYYITEKIFSSKINIRIKRPI